MSNTKLIATDDATRPTGEADPVPQLTAAKIGLVSRDYRHSKDFSAVFQEVLRQLDEQGCETVLFSPWSVMAENSCTPSVELRSVKSVLYETFTVEREEPRGKTS